MIELMLCYGPQSQDKGLPGGPGTYSLAVVVDDLVVVTDFVVVVIFFVMVDPNAKKNQIHAVLL